MAAIVSSRAASVRLACQKSLIFIIILFYVAFMFIGGSFLASTRKQTLLPLAEAVQFNNFVKQNNGSSQKQQQQYVSLDPTRKSSNYSAAANSTKDSTFYAPVVVRRAKRATQLKFARFDVSDWGEDDTQNDGKRIIEPSDMFLSFDTSKDGDDDSSDDMFHAQQETAAVKLPAAPENLLEEEFDDDVDRDADDAGDDDAENFDGTLLFDEAEKLVLPVIEEPRKTPPVVAGVAKIVAHDAVAEKKRLKRSAQNQKAVRRKPTITAVAPYIAFDAAAKAERKRIAELRQDAYSDARKARREKSLAAGEFPQVGDVRLSHGEPEEQCPSGFYYVTHPQVTRNQFCLRFTRTPLPWGRASMACARLSGAFMPIFPADLAQTLPWIMQHRGIPSFWIRNAYKTDGSGAEGFMNNPAIPTQFADWSPRQANKDAAFRAKNPAIMYILQKPDQDRRKIFHVQTMPLNYRAYAMCAAPVAFPNNKEFRVGHRGAFHVLSFAESKPYCPEKFRKVLHVCLYISDEKHPWDQQSAVCDQLGKNIRALSALSLPSMGLLSEMLIRHKAGHTAWVKTRYVPNLSTWMWGPSLNDGLDKTQIMFKPGNNWAPSPIMGLYIDGDYNQLGQRKVTESDLVVCVARARHPKNEHKHHKANANALKNADDDEAAAAGDDDAANGGGDKPAEARTKVGESAAVAAIVAPSSVDEAAKKKEEAAEEEKKVADEKAAAESEAASAEKKAADGKAADEAASMKKAADEAEAAKAEEAEKQAEEAKKASAEQEEAAAKATEAEKAAEEAKDEADKKTKEAEQQAENAEKVDDKLQQKAEEMKAGPGGGDDDEDKHKKHKKDKKHKEKHASDDWDPSHYEIHSIPASAIEQSSNTTFERLFGHKIMDLGETFNNLDPAIATDSSHDAETARSLLMIMLSNWYTTIDQHHPNEIAKKLLRKIMLRHKPRQCYSSKKPIPDESDRVICLSTAGPIHLCYKQDALDGTISRGCGIPDKKIFWGHNRCHVDMEGVFCFCEGDMCNAAPKRLNFGFVSLSFSVLASLMLFCLS